MLQVAGLEERGCPSLRDPREIILQVPDTGHRNADLVFPLLCLEFWCGHFLLCPNSTILK